MSVLVPAVSSVTLKDGVTLKGRTAQQITWFSAEAIRDTDLHAPAAVDLTEYRDLGYFARTDLDQDVTIYFSPYAYVDINTRVWDGIEWSVDERQVVLPADGDRIYVLHTMFPWLRAPVNQMRVSAQCTVAPSSGSLTLVAFGVPN